MFFYRITKYNPELRDSQGRYCHDEWTDYSDIGKSFGGHTFTTGEYTAVENRYIAFALAVIKQQKLHSLAVEELEVWGNNHSWNGIKTVQVSQLPALMKSCLRNEVWCKITGDAFYIHFGYDYYMYVGSTLPYPDISTVATQHSLYCEKWPSPYAAATDESNK